MRAVNPLRAGSRSVCLNGFRHAVRHRWIGAPSRAKVAPFRHGTKMQGIELSHRFYLDVVRPWLLATVPDLPHAAALIGYGSELLGLDDAMSRDHNWAPGFTSS